MIRSQLRKALDKRMLRLLLRDSFLAGIASGFSRLFLLGLSLVVSRTVGSQSEFGLFSSAILFVQLAAMLASLGVAQTATQAVAASATSSEKQQQVVRSILLVMLSMGSAAFVVIVLGAPLLSAGLGHKVPVNMLRAVSALVFLQLFQGGLEGILRGKLAFKWLPGAAVAATVVALAAGYPMISRFGPWGGLASLGLFLAVQIGVLFTALRISVVGPRLPRAELRKLLGGVAVPTFLSGLFWNLAMMIPPLLLVRTVAGLEQVALWNATSQLRTLISFAPIVIVNSSIPHVLDRMRTGTLSGREVITAIVLPMAVALVPYLPAVAFSGRLMSAYGHQYTAHGPLLIWVSSYVLLQVLGVGLFGFVLASGKLWNATFVNILWFIVVIGSTPWVLPAGGVYGLAKLYLVTYIPVDLALAVLAYRAVSSASPAEEPTATLGVIAAMETEEG